MTVCHILRARGIPCGAAISVRHSLAEMGFRDVVEPNRSERAGQVEC
jgi:hypothetical protein